MNEKFQTPLRALVYESDKFFLFSFSFFLLFVMRPTVNKQRRLCSAVRQHRFLYQLPGELQGRLLATKSTTYTTEYLDQVNKASLTLDADAKRKKQLLILDLNGTLLSRTNRRGGMYVRPHMDSFLDYIFTHFRVMVWSSAQKASVKQMMKFFTVQQTSKMVLTWDRSHFGLSKKDFNNKTATIKDLKKVWQTKGLHFFDASNTVILDDSPSKCVLQPFNSIHLPTFDHRDPKFLEHGDQVLLSVMEYLERIERQTNIPNFVRKVPFAWTPPLEANSMDRICHYYSFKNADESLECDFAVQQPASRI